MAKTTKNQSSKSKGSVSSSKKKPMSTGVKILLGCIGLVVAGGICFAIVSALGIFGLGKAIENAEETAANEEQTAWDNAGGLNEAVSVESIQWTVREAKDLGSELDPTSEYGDPCVAKSGTFIYVKIKVKNNTSDMQSATGLQLYDSEKREYVSSSDVYGCIDEDEELFILDNINPGIELTYIDVYEVPEDASGFKLKVTDLQLFGDSYAYIDLDF